MDFVVSPIWIALLPVLMLILWVWALIDMFRLNVSSSDRMWWIVIVVLFPLIGSILYFQIGRPNLKKLAKS